MSLDRAQYENRLRELLSTLKLHNDARGKNTEFWGHHSGMLNHLTYGSIENDRVRCNLFFSPAEIEHNMVLFESKMRAVYDTVCSEGEYAILCRAADLSYLANEAASWNSRLEHHDIKQVLTAFVNSCHAILTKPLTDLVDAEFQQWLIENINIYPPDALRYLISDDDELDKWMKPIRHYHGNRSPASDLAALKIAYARRYLSRLMASDAPEIVNNTFLNPSNKEGKLLRDIMLDLCSAPDSAYDRFIQMITAAFRNQAGLTQENLKLYTSIAGVEASKAFLLGVKQNLSKLSMLEVAECYGCVSLLLQSNVDEARALLQSREQHLLQTRSTISTKAKPASSRWNIFKRSIVKDKQSEQPNPEESFTFSLFKKASKLLSEGKKDEAKFYYTLVIDALRGQRAGAPFEKFLSETGFDDAIIEIRTLVNIGTIQLDGSITFINLEPFLYLLGLDTANTVSNSNLLSCAGKKLLTTPDENLAMLAMLAIPCFIQALKLDRNNSDAKKALTQLANEYSDAREALLQLEHESKVTTVSAAIATPPAPPSQLFTPAAAAATPTPAAVATRVPAAKAAVKPPAVTPQRSTSAIAAAIATPPDAPSGVINIASVTPQRSASAAAITTPPAPPSQAAIRHATAAAAGVSNAALMSDCWKERTVASEVVAADSQRGVVSRHPSIVKRS